MSSLGGVGALVGLRTAGPAAASVGKLRVGLSAITAWSLALPIMVAREKGYLADAGIADLEPKMAGGQIIPAMLGGSLDLGHDASTYDVVTANARGEAVYAVAGYFGHMFFHFIVAKDIKTLDDLKGKVVGIDMPGSPRDQYARKALRWAGLDPDRDVRIVPAGVSPERYKALVAGRIHASVIAFDAANLFAEGYKALIDLRRVFPGEYPIEVVAATGSFLEKNEAAVVAYLKAMIRAMRFIKDRTHKEECLEIGQKLGLKNREFAAPQYDLFTEAYPEDLEVTAGGVQKIVDALRETRRIPEGFEASKVLRITPLRRAQRELSPRR